MRKRILIALAVAAAVILATTGAIAAGGDDDAGENLTGPDADRAAEAALAVTGGGTVDGVERDDGGGAAFEVEVTKPDGTSVEVFIDENFQPAGTDAETSDDDDGGQDDDGGG